MPTFTNVMYTRVFRPYYYYIITAVILIIFIMASVYGFKWFYGNSQKNAQFKDVANAQQSNKPLQIFFFNVDWCPHCKTALPEWQAFSDEFNGQIVNGYLVTCTNQNCTDSDDPQVTYLINQYNIESYPTVKMVKEGTQIEFDAKITKSSLTQFVLQVTNN